MENRIETKYTRDYYKGKKLSALSMLVTALVLICCAFVLFLVKKQALIYGLSGGLIVLSVLQIINSLIVWGYVHFAERKLISGNLTKSHLETEHQFIKKKAARYPKIRMVQEVFFGLAFIGIFLGMAKVINPTSMGIALALILMMAIWIVKDLFAQRRAEEYERFLRRVIAEN
jgi:uncharacterized membrane protein (DUF485 family)